jgi:hypothetical protein
VTDIMIDPYKFLDNIHGLTVTGFTFDGSVLRLSFDDGSHLTIETPHDGIYDLPLTLTLTHD